MVFVKNSLKFASLTKYTIKAKGSTYEQLALKLNNHLIIVFYKPPQENITKVIEAWETILINECTTSTIPVFIGDINYDVTERPLANFLRQMGLKNYQTESTRGNRVLDVCISYENGAHLQSGTLDAFAFSDHTPITVNINGICKERVRVEVEYYRDRKLFTFENFNVGLMNAPWQQFDQELESSNVDSALEVLAQNMNDVFNALTPIRKRRKCRKQFPYEIRCWMSTRNTLFKLSKNTDDEGVIAEYKRIRNFVKSLVRSYERNRIEEKLKNCNKNFHKTWNVLNSMMGRKERKPVEVDSEILNEYFAKPKDWSNINAIQIVSNSTEEKAKLREIEYETFFKALQKIPTYKSHGIDGISAEMLKLAKHFLAPKLIKLFNFIIRTGHFPNQWKRGKVVALYKNNGDVKDPGNYRPITLLSVTSKLFERCISDQIYDLLIPKIPRFQHGFRREHSVVTATLEVTEHIYESLNNRDLAYVAQLDIQKAYDTVNPYILLQKFIDAINPCTAMERLMQSYLFDRKICTHTQNGTSQFRDVAVGVPQGAVLSPILFNFYMADLNNLSLHGKLVAFADDVQLLYSAERTKENLVESMIDADIKQIERFLEERFMKLNNNKTVVTRFGSTHLLSKVDPDKCFYVGGIHVKLGGLVRNLGLYLDSTLTFRPYFDKVAHQCSTTLYHLKAIRPYIGMKNSLVLVNSLVISRITTFLPITMTATKKDIAVLQKILNHAIRVIYEKRKFDHISDVKINHKWNDINSLAEAEFRKIVSKVFNKNTSDFLNNLLIQKNHGRTRSSFFEYERSKNTYGDRTFRHRASTLLNQSL